MNWTVTMFIYNTNGQTYMNAERLPLLDDDNVILNPVYTKKINEAGTFDFTILPNHELYEYVEPLCCYVEVFYKDDLKWRGRVDSVELDLRGVKIVHCLGMLSVLNDTVQFARREGTNQNDVGVVEVKTMKIHNIISRILDIHDCGIMATCNGFQDTSDIKCFMQATVPSAAGVVATYLHEDGSTLETIRYFAELSGLYVYCYTRLKSQGNYIILVPKHMWLSNFQAIDVRIGENIVDASVGLVQPTYYNAIVARGKYESASAVNQSGLKPIEAPRHVDIKPSGTNGVYLTPSYSETSRTNTDFIGTSDVNEFAKYGIIYGFARNEALEAQAEVKSWAQMMIEAASNQLPESKVSIKATVANISTPDGTDIFDIDILSMANVTCDTLGIYGLEIGVTAIEVDLSNPSKAVFTFGYEDDDTLTYEVN